MGSQGGWVVWPKGVGMELYEVSVCPYCCGAPCLGARCVEEVDECWGELLRSLEGGVGWWLSEDWCI